MALIKSTLLAQISGSINGTTFSHNRGGSYARSRAMVSNPQTARQSEVRTALTSLSTMWRDSLTQAQRDLWNAYGSQVSIVNRVGDTISLSGISAFQRVNMFRVATLDMAPTLNPPPESSLPPGTVVPAFVSASLSNVISTPTLAVAMTATGATNFGLAVYYGSPVSPGIKYFRGPYAGRVVGAVTADPAEVELPALPDTAGFYIPMKIQLYSLADSLPIWTVYQEPLVTTDPV